VAAIRDSQDPQPFEQRIERPIEGVWATARLGLHVGGASPV
jgi:hypothetical protein